jgi:hypothetical protein
MKNNIFKDQVIQYIKDNPGKTSHEIKCGATTETLSVQLTSKVQNILVRLVKLNTITRTPIDPTRPHLGYHFWYNADRISLDNELGLSPAQQEIKNKAAEKVDFILNLIETKPGITSSRLRSQFSIMGHGSADSASRIFEKLLADKLVKRQQIQVGNPGAGFQYWAADAIITHTVPPTSNRVRPAVSSSTLSPTEPVANFPVAMAVDTSNANIEIAIRLCEIEAFRKPELFKAFMECAENIRKLKATA